MSGQRTQNARWIALTTLAKAHPGWFVLIVALSAISGTLPAVFALLVARLVTGLPAAVGSGFGSPAGQSVLATLVGIGIVLVLQECMVFRGTLAEDHFWRYDGYLLGRIMRTTLSADRLELFEDPTLAAKRERGIRFVPASPGEIIAGYEGKWTMVAGGLAATVLVATVWPVAAIALAVAWLAFGYTLHGDYLRTREDADDPKPRARYAKELSLLPQFAKEVRVFGLVDWLADRFGREWLQVMEALWRARRAHRAKVAYGFGVVFAANAAVLALAAHAATKDRLSVGALTVLVQGMLGMAALADQSNEYLIDLGALPMPAVAELVESAAGLDAPRGQVAVADRPAEEILLDGVSFAYPGGNSAVFDRLDLRIAAGRSLGVVGLNGAGKTTLIKLLTGLETPTVGRILVDGIDLAELDQQIPVTTIPSIRPTRPPIQSAW